jgi:hypothetical protein
MSYHLEGDLLEVCTCKILCPCWVGEVPDGDGRSRGGPRERLSPPD